MPPPTPPLHTAILTLPRTASNLLVRILNLEHQPSVLRHPRDGYLFLPSMRFKAENDMHARFPSAWSPAERSAMSDVLDSCVTAWMRHVGDAEARGRGTCVTEHVNWMVRPGVEGGVGGDGYVGNPTCLSDAFLREKLGPTLLIRHPALVVPSLLRTALDNEGLEAMMEEGAEERMRREVSYRWHVAIYDMFVNEVDLEGGEDTVCPIVIDAADLVDEGLVRKYAAAIGLDPSVLRFEWDVESAEGMGDVEARMKDTLMGSTGVVKDRLGGCGLIDLDALNREWRHEFGEHLGSVVGRLVRGALPEYEWLWEKRFKG